MADFSKQWCDINDPEMPWDFDIIEEADRLNPGEEVYIICEGFGFSSIAKMHDNTIQCYFSDENLWVPYDQVVSGAYDPNNFTI